ncbi:MAG: hypothetical protein ACREDA_01995 [Methylocella sp.]
MAPRTFERYQAIVRKNLVPFVGLAVLAQVRPDQIAAAQIDATMRAAIDRGRDVQ